MAMAVAERGSLSSSAISPKKSPGPRMDRITSRPSSPRMVTLIRPSRIMKKKSPSSFSKKMTVSLGYRRRVARWERLAMSPSDNSAKIGTVRRSSCSSMDRDPIPSGPLLGAVFVGSGGSFSGRSGAEEPDQPLDDVHRLLARNRPPGLEGAVVRQVHQPRADHPRGGIADEVVARHVPRVGQGARGVFGQVQHARYGRRQVAAADDRRRLERMVGIDVEDVEGEGADDLVAGPRARDVDGDLGRPR